MTEDMDRIALEGQIKNIQTLIELDEEDIKGYTEDLATQNITEGPHYDETMEIIREKKIHLGELYKKLEILKDETLSSKERILRSLRVC
ncbi:MAG TPA: hypothetical protein PLY82_09700 [Methanosarcina thermophila]|jgi:hypothetical protein|uniref:DUF2383 domain-containing protein n=2 Tax=Methanosarcina TaxID=2207 RepID=A0A660HPY8_9EURY|nr:MULTISPECIES: hypothetical protein [Methanosarcina]AKB14255.1 hypothetical protein MSTHT_2497 [Methanosarcina thermophila TM-1]AYK14282.1 hypothetical protein AOB57_002935 [Methanosarcina flavescens]HOQ66204.1 hypothetical protein [Methanosarcina thermophila]HPT81373.1 hypothetical protein [Methanosarcina thermophila]